ncbi:MAG: hypothetical protein K2X87_32000 [Gemmataceae bacterium]|nr:hypothetical protein [Gemmataceae bacterium]
MTDGEAKDQLGRLLDRYTVGSVLHLLADVVRNHGEAARSAGDEDRSDQYRQAEAVLYVVGLGIDAALPP